MTTVQDLLDTARAFCNLAERETNRGAGRLEMAAQYAAIAQAHAATAQAMMLAEMTETGQKVDFSRGDKGVLVTSRRLQVDA
jgi:hypothetical protein